jgi:hypothetical protein
MTYNNGWFDLAHGIQNWTGSRKYSTVQRWVAAMKTFADQQITKVAPQFQDYYKGVIACAESYEKDESSDLMFDYLMVKGKHFSLYYAGHMAIDPERPWQLIGYPMPALGGKFATKEQGEKALHALDAAHEDGTLPCNIREWDKYKLYYEIEN